MEEKDRDIWDEAIRSKLHDFEVDASPGDWEAIEERLPSKAPISLRRSLRYWAAAAVASLLLLSGGIYWLDREIGNSPIAREMSIDPRDQGVSEEPLSPLAAKKEEAPVLAVVSAPSRPGLGENRAVAGAKARTLSLPVDGRVEAVDAPVSAVDTPVAEETVVEEATPVDDKAPMKANRDRLASSNRGERSAKVSVSRGGKRKSQTSRKWGFGMGGGGFSMSADNMIPQYVTNSSVLKSDNLMSLNALDAEKKDLAKTDVRHRTPIGIGISVSRYLNERFSLQSGLTYSYLRSEWTTNNTYHVDNDQRLHFIGIPLSLSYKIAEWNRFLFYASAGGMAEVNVAGKRRMRLFSDDVEISRTNERVRMKEWLWSVNARAGVSYPVIRFVSAFAEVGAGYYFDNGSEIETIHSEKPFNVSLQFGFRFGF